MMNIWCVHDNLLPFGQYWIYLLRLMSVANFKGVSDMSIIYNNTLMTEGSEGLFYLGCSLFNMRTQTVYKDNTYQARSAPRRLMRCWQLCLLIPAECMWCSLTFFAVVAIQERYSGSRSSCWRLPLLQKKVRCRSPCTWNMTQKYGFCLLQAAHGINSLVISNKNCHI